VPVSLEIPQIKPPFFFFFKYLDFAEKAHSSLMLGDKPDMPVEICIS
jgi:hypothetical protein